MRRWSTWIMQLFAFWIAVSPWVDHAKGMAAWTDIVFGALALAAGTIGEEALSGSWQAVAAWARAVCGLFFVLGGLWIGGHATGGGNWLDVILGALILLGGVFLGLRPTSASGRAAHVGATT
jgi:hypothetical protein